MQCVVEAKEIVLFYDFSTGELIRHTDRYGLIFVNAIYQTQFLATQFLNPKPTDYPIYWDH